MKPLIRFLNNMDTKIKKGPFKIIHPMFGAINTMLFTPGHATSKGPHIRDSIDMKRFMGIVIFALVPSILVGSYNVGYQAGVEGIFAAFMFGFLKLLPILVVTYAVGLGWEMIFGYLRGHDIHEGFLVTGILLPLTLPPTIPLWQVAVAVSFATVIGKEVFGGTGMNLLNPALTARAFLFFTYPGDISGDRVWVALDGFTGATPLAAAAAAQGSAVEALNAAGFTLDRLFFGFVSGSIGETSAIAILIGAAILLITGVGSWRIMLATTLGAYGMALLIQFLGADATGMRTLPAHYHLVMGGFMFGMVFMATDPVTAAGTNAGKWVYGLLIGFMVILIRTFNPAYPEGMMLAILFANVFSPLIDHFVVKANIKRRLNYGK
ncbi:MAG: NADH:ubiquinone reductase (Na(+)-transporting) subunit B [Candidatus Marinimicrobia bacterium]|nr:NADH:ubiquinone reductase (Na(+)-transporting) subunit B [Candidatus Neomarinimicrobiota bacterium]MCF7851175.1 NADH:ubiquinone reductase (Na(+)-transporting) subunit B [Candidatus Neomarinimicrobiota bacterium]MCF7904242.1 NADH:ubiquinone reductase (Na(+)-transporting) subunit B [Candidatus Neomarinimicrobiota bacterium]